MTSPLFIVVVLTVLWLIVLVPMIVRRNDDVAKERQVHRFGASMRALGRRSSVRDSDDTETAGWVQPRINGPRSEVHVHGAADTADLSTATRRPVPAAREALMYPTDRADMSEARQQMMARRRRSLTILTVGSVLTLIFGLVLGGPVWIFTALFLAGLGGYVMFLRAQALKDRDRRAARLERSTVHRSQGYEATEDLVDTADPTIVRIDDDDLALHNLDTIDLTGLYAAGVDERREELTAFSARRAG